LEFVILAEMGNKSVLSEIGSLMSSHPYVSCSLLVFLTPPFFPILKFFSPLLISTALFVVALVTMGPHFEQPPNQDDDFLMNAADFKTEDDQGAGDGRDQGDDAKPIPSSWLKSWKESSISWVEKKLQKENWKGTAPNDNNVSILQEAFAHRAPQVPTKLVTRRIPDDEEEERSVEIPALSHSDSWTSDRSFDRLPSSNSRDHLPHNLFSPHPSFSRRQDSDVNPLYEDVIPPPIDYDMPPLITGPASLTAPLFKSLEDDDDMYYSSDDEYDHHHSDHEHLEVGESTVLIPHDHVPVENGIHDQAPVENLVPSLVDEPMDSSLPSTHEGSPSPGDDEGHLPSTEERSVPVPETHHQNQEEVHDIPELEEDVLPVDTQSREINPAEGLAAESLPDEAVLPDSAPTHDHVGDVLPDSAPTHDHVGDVLPDSAPTHDHVGDVLPDSAPTHDHVGEALSSVPGEVPPYVVERSMSLPVHGSSEDTESHEELPPLDTALPEEPSASLSHSISLPAALHPIRPIILPPKTTDQGPASPDTDLGTATTFEAPDEGHNSVSEDEPSKQLSTKEKLLKIEALSSSMPATEDEAEQVAHVTGKMKSFVEDAKKFQPDAPQLQITPPSSKVVFAPSPGKPTVVVAGAGPTIRPPPSSRFPSQYSSDDSEEAGDEETDLEDSDVEVVGEDSDSDLDLPAGLKAPPPHPVDHHIVVQA
jgi:hypothetical protein